MYSEFLKSTLISRVNEVLTFGQGRGGGSRIAATSKMEFFVIILCDYYHKQLHLGWCSSPRSASGPNLVFALKLQNNFQATKYCFILYPPKDEILCKLYPVKGFNDTMPRDYFAIKTLFT